MSALLGMDFGGGAIKLGLVTAEGVVQARAVLPLDAGQSFATMAAAVAEASGRLAAGRPFAAVGISAPGHADPETGILVDGTHNVPLLTGQPLPAAFAERMGVPAFLDNDGSCATLGELLYGAGQPFRRFVLISIGTGVGGGVVVDGRLVTGPSGQPPEIGALCLDPHGPPSHSGIRGAFERMASAAAFVERYEQERGHEAASAKDVFRLAGQADRRAMAAVDGVGRVIAQAFGIMINLMNLEACIIGGGVSAAGEPLLDAVRRHLPFFTWPALHRNTQVLLAAHGNDAGIIGAAALAAQRIGLR
jgi:glucokinase